MPTAALRGLLAFAIILCLIGSDPKQPGLELAIAVEGFDIFYDGKESFLADLLRVLTGEGIIQLENETPGSGIVQAKELVPRGRFSAPAAGKQICFSGRGHDPGDSRPMAPI